MASNSPLPLTHQAARKLAESVDAAIAKIKIGLVAHMGVDSMIADREIAFALGRAAVRYGFNLFGGDFTAALDRLEVQVAAADATLAREKIGGANVTNGHEDPERLVPRRPSSSLRCMSPEMVVEKHPELASATQAIVDHADAIANAHVAESAKDWRSLGVRFAGVDHDPHVAKALDAVHNGYRSARSYQIALLDAGREAARFGYTIRRVERDLVAVTFHVVVG